jgi:putative transposase
VPERRTRRFDIQGNSARLLAVILKNAPMSSTHHALSYHLIFGTKDRMPYIAEPWRSRLHEYLGGCIKGLGGVPTEIGGVADHVHLLVSLRPTHQLSEVMRDVKRKTSAWIHQEMGERRFGWQDGYGAFTVSLSNVRRVREYIQKQEEHHRARTFREEYLSFLKRHLIEFKDEYV